MLSARSTLADPARFQPPTDPMACGDTRAALLEYRVQGAVAPGESSARRVPFLCRIAADVVNQQGGQTMFRSKMAIALVVSLAVVGMTAQAASADPPPKAEIGGMYSLHHNDIGTFPIGWVFTVGGNVTSWMAIVGEVGGGYKSLTESGADVTIREHTVLGGVKVASRRSGAAVPFVQVLTGVGNIGAGALGYSASINAFALQTGGGVDVKMSARTALRIQGDYRMLRRNSENLNEYRFAVGVMFGIGKR
jgi:hypothetical protein